MRSRLLRLAPLRAVFAGAAVLALAVPHTPAQQVVTQPVSTARPADCLPSPYLVPTPATPGVPSASGMTSSTAGVTDGTLSLAGGGLSAAVGGETVALDGAAYIDDAIPRTQFRIRFDAAYDDNRPDRDEFFYAKCGCFRTLALSGGSGGDPRAPGPPLPETRVDYQEASAYLELAPTSRLSGFVELPVRFINPDQNQNASGIGDVNFGAKFAFIATEDTYLTFQGRVYVPTGDAFKGLGTHHTTLEPAILLYQRLADRLSLQAEFLDWIPTDGTDWAGNVIQYGIGFTYLACNGPSFRIMPVAELVGWTALSGKELTSTGATENAEGDTIVNAKVGVRFGFGSLEERGLLSQSDLYVGYGRALTGEVWYKDFLRVEYRMRF